MCLLVIIGVRADGRKELVALADGFRESAESWADLLRDCQTPRHDAPRCWRSATARSGSGRRSATCSPRPASSAAGGTRSATSSPRCRSRPTRPRRQALAEIYNAEDKTHARAAAKAFAAEFGAKWPKAAAKITDDLDVLLAFYDYPAEHWIHLRTTNPIESTFATVRLRHPGHQGPRLPGRRRRDGVQADRVSPDPVADASTHPTSSPWSAPAPPSSTANSSNDPTTKINKEVISKRRETRRSTDLRSC